MNLSYYYNYELWLISTYAKKKKRKFVCKWNEYGLEVITYKQIRKEKREKLWENISYFFSNIWDNICYAIYYLPFICVGVLSILAAVLIVVVILYLV